MARLLLALGGTISLGILSRLYPVGWSVYDKSLGDILYAVAAYLALAVLRPRWSPALLAGLALAACLAVEAMQATGLPAQYADSLVIRWLIGTTFAWHDIGCYVVGVALIAAADGHWLRPHG